MASRILYPSLEGQLGQKERHSQDLALKPSGTEVRGSFHQRQNICLGRTCQLTISRVRERWSKTDPWKLISFAKTIYHSWNRHCFLPSWNTCEQGDYPTWNKTIFLVWLYYVSFRHSSSPERGHSPVISVSTACCSLCDLACFFC